MFKYTHINCIYIYIYTHIQIYRYICIYLYIYIYIERERDTHIYIYIYIYIYIFAGRTGARAYPADLVRRHAHEDLLLLVRLRRVFVY